MLFHFAPDTLVSVFAIYIAIAGERENNSFNNVFAMIRGNFLRIVSTRVNSCFKTCSKMKFKLIFSCSLGEVPSLLPDQIDITTVTYTSI